jgi:hypothetical protein
MATSQQVENAAHELLGAHFPSDVAHEHCDGVDQEPLPREEA